MRALVLGCGPAGLLAAHALVTRGHRVTIMSKKRKSEMYGAQYLHERIPDLGMEREGTPISYMLSGSIEEYRKKVYGENWSGVVSPDEYGREEDHKGWNIRVAYDSLWHLYHDAIIDRDFRYGADVESTVAEMNPDIVASSLPLPSLCLRRDEHVFNAQRVYAIGDAPERGVFCPVQAAPANTVLCNGEPDVGWYRTANVFGYRTAEWPAFHRPPYEGVAEVVKPLNTTCDCQERVIRVGRYGRWKKGVLSHEAFDDLMEQYA
jgi:hypothetical protein